VIAREPDRLHDRFRAGHVERHCVVTGDLPKAFDVLGDDRMIGPQHRAEFTRALDGRVDAAFVELVSEHIDAVRACQIEAFPPVEIDDSRPVGSLHERGRREMRGNVSRKLERHPIMRREFQIGDDRHHRSGCILRLLSFASQLGTERRKRFATPSLDLLRRTVTVEEARSVVIPRRNRRRDQLRQARMPLEGRMLRPRELQPEDGAAGEPGGGGDARGDHRPSHLFAS
jgi:hypothetical protein